MQVNVRLFAAIILGLLLIWIGVTGRLGSLLAALITPDALTEGQPPATGTAVIPNYAPNSPIAAAAAAGVANANKKGVLSAIEIVDFAIAAGLTGVTTLQIATAIALAESGGNTQAVSSTGDYGVWQINYNSHRNLGYSQTQLLDPSINARAMATISQNGTNWNPWTTYKTGAYQSFMIQAGQAVRAVYTANG
jgi:Lysozyme like domain